MRVGEADVLGIDGGPREGRAAVVVDVYIDVVGVVIILLLLLTFVVMNQEKKAGDER